MLASLSVACAPVNSTNILFTSEPIASRAELANIRHSGDFILFYDREQANLYGMVEKSDLNRLPQSRIKQVNWTGPESLSAFFNYIPKPRLTEKCATNFSVKPEKIEDEFLAQFDEVIDEFRKLGYPITGATYVGGGDGYEVELTYFSECKYIERDAEELARKLSGK